MHQKFGPDEPQVLYQGRWVDRSSFRVYVFNTEGKKLANSYKDYTDLIESGLWFATIEDIEPKTPVHIKTGRKAKNVTNS